MGEPAAFTDEELTALALEADPREALSADAVPFDDGSDRSSGLLPEWYMPAPASFRRTPRRVVVASTVVVSLLALNALGLCVTYGVLEVAW